VEKDWTQDRDLTLAERRLIVAWTWPNEEGAPAYFLPLDEPAGMDSSVYIDFSPEAVRKRVATFCIELGQPDMYRDSIYALEDFEPEMGEWFHRARRMRQPLCVEDLIQFSSRIGLAFHQAAGREDIAAWHIANDRAAALRRWTEMISEPSGPIARMKAALEEEIRRAMDKADVTTNATRFGLSLPTPPKPGTKYEVLYRYLDGIATPHDEPFSVTFGDLAEVLAAEHSQRGAKQAGLPPMAFDNPRKFWVNKAPLTAQQRDAYRHKNEGQRAPKRTMVQPRAWRATALTVSSRIVSRGDKEVVEITFTPEEGRGAWWPQREAIRSGEQTYETPRGLWA